MSASEIDIANLALSIIGADSIRSFEETNKRARMCKNFYCTTRNYLLSRFDWTFARRYKELSKVTLPPGTTPPGMKTYMLPADCSCPRDLHPPGGIVSWSVSGNTLLTKVNKAGLYYTGICTDTSMFSGTFVSLVGLGMAVRLCGPVAQNTTLTNTLYKQFLSEIRECTETDANTGNDFRAPSDDPTLDSFVTGNPLGEGNLAIGLGIEWE